MTDMEKVYEEHRKMHEKFRAVPRWGKLVEFRGEKYKVYPTVFWPMADCEPLIDHYEIYPGDRVLDVGTGTGVIAIDAAKKEASYVLAVDVNPKAIKAARENAERFGVRDKIEVKQRWLLENLWGEQTIPLDSRYPPGYSKGERFDVIVGNLPFYDHKTKHPPDFAESTTWNEGLTLYKVLFAVTARYELSETGRIYLAQSNLGPIDRVMEIAENQGFVGKKIGEKTITVPLNRTFYAIELRRKR